MAEEGKKLDWETERRIDDLQRHIRGLRIITFVTLFVALFSVGMGLALRSGFDAPLNAITNDILTGEIQALEKRMSDKLAAATKGAANASPARASLAQQLGSTLTSLEAMAKSGSGELKEAAIDAGRSLKRVADLLDKPAK